MVWTEDNLLAAIDVLVMMHSKCLGDGNVKKNLKAKRFWIEFSSEFLNALEVLSVERKLNCLQCICLCNWILM